MPVYKQLLEQIEKVAKIGNWELDVATGVTIWSPQVYEIYKIPQGTPVDKIKGLEFYAPHERARLSRLLELAIQEKRHFDDTFEFYDAEGTAKWVRSIGSPQMDEKGQVYKIFGVFQDVTQIKNQEQESKLVLAATKAGVWQWDIKNDILKWDDALYDIFGIDRTKFAGAYEAWQASLHPDYKAEIEEELQKALRGEKAFDSTITILKSDGSTAYLGGRGVVQFDSKGQPVSMYGINWDRTEEVIRQQELEKQKKIAAQASKLASIGQLAAGIGHEVNNPLSIIVGHLETLESALQENERIESSKILEQMGKIGHATERIRKIIKGLKRFSRESEGKRIIFAVHQSVGEALTLVGDMYAKEGIQIDYQISGNPDLATVFGDPIEFQQVLMNLLANARDAMVGQSRKHVQIYQHLDKDKVVLEIKNSGPQIDTDLADRIFDPFFTTKPIGEGTGIGLYIVKNIIESMSGLIELTKDSQTCFRIQLPMSLQKGVITPPPPALPRKEPVKMPAASILVVEDEVALASLITGFLKRAGHQVVTCSSGTEALKVLDQSYQRFDLVISDAKMPELSGEELFAALRKHPRHQESRFILMSGNMNYDSASFDTQTNQSDTGLPDAFIAKPFRREELLALINKVLGGGA